MIRFLIMFREFNLMRASMTGMLIGILSVVQGSFITPVLAKLIFLPIGYAVSMSLGLSMQLFVTIGIYLLFVTGCVAHYFSSSKPSLMRGIYLGAIFCMTIYIVQKTADIF